MDTVLRIAPENDTIAPDNMKISDFILHGVTFWNMVVVLVAIERITNAVCLVYDVEASPASSYSPCSLCERVAKGSVLKRKSSFRCRGLRYFMVYTSSFRLGTKFLFAWEFIFLILNCRALSNISAHEEWRLLGC
jgi:hypothetical protein